MEKKLNPQLELAISEARRKMTDAQVVEHVIKLYGAEIEKANNEIFRLKNAGDEMFKIKQRTVIANNELKTKLARIRNLYATRELTLHKLDAVIAGVEEDFVWRFANDLKFHEFVEHVCAQMRARHP